MTSDNEHVLLPSMTADQLARLGVSQIAYVKPVVMNGAHGFAIHAADGTPMALTADRDVAIAAILRHEMLPVSVH
ncbi:MAG: DUF1150 family protein [Acetobacteraceae bacterium]